MATILTKGGRVLKAQNRWASFDGTSSSLRYADADIFSFTDGVNDIPFEIELDLIRTSIVSGGNNRILFKGTTTFEWAIDFLVNTNTMRFFLLNTTGTAYIMASYTIILNTNYHFKFKYDGSKTAAGLKIYNNSVLLATTNTTVGSYAGMTNLNVPFYVSFPAAGYYFPGYIRNVKISKAGQLIFNVPLQDANNIGRDIVGGISPNLTTNVSIANQIETQNWSYFNGNNGSGNIGTSTTFGWMNSGTFYIEFDIKPLDLTNGKTPLGTTTIDPAQRGFAFYCFTGGYIRVYWENAGGAHQYLAGTTLTVGTSYRFTLKGNSTQWQYIQYNLDNNTQIYDSGLIACTYVANASTNGQLYLGSTKNVTYNNCQLRNFKIFTDFAGTVPFLSLPMQSSIDLMLDRVNGLQGTVTNVSIVNKNTNILRNKNLYLKFNDSAFSTVSFGSVSTLAYMHSTGIFRFEFNFINNATQPTYLFRTCANTSQNGFYLMARVTDIQFNMGNLANGFLIQQNISLTQGVEYHIKLYGDGSRFYYDVNGVVNSVAFSGTKKAAGNTAVLPTFSINAASYLTGYLNNFKIYNTSDTAGLIYHFPFQDGGNFSKEVITGINATTAGILKVVEM